MADSPFRPQGSGSRVLAELARLWDQARVHTPGRVTQKELARLSGVPHTTVNGWATGAAEPRTGPGTWPDPFPARFLWP
ncbi:helix-turn-helix domain-containing protein [Nonomuraea sp. NPDC001684]